MMYLSKIKRILLIPVILASTFLSVNAQLQVPEGINYQAVIRDKDGTPIANQNVVINISVYSGAQADVLEWKEFHSISTSKLGLVTFVIGKGTSTLQGRANTFLDVPWGDSSLSINVTVNYGQGEVDLGFVKLQSVPYAFVAQKVLSVDYNDLVNKPSLTEYDPVYLNSVAANIKASDTTRWSKPSSFTGDYNDLLNKPSLAIVATSGSYMDLLNRPNLNGYITTETDPLYQASAASTINSTDITRWNSISNFSGNYNDLTNKPNLATVATSGNFNDLTIKPTTLAGYGITDAMGTNHAANGITMANISGWNTAYGWGNHATAGYLKSYTETDPVFNNIFSISSPTNNQLLRYNSASGKWENYTPAGTTTYVETDPLWSAVSGNYYTKANMQTGGSAQLHFSNITNKPTTLSGYGITDAMGTSHAANGITSTNISSWNAAYGWGNHATQGYLKTYTETDPVYLASAANAITSANIANWTTAYSWGNHAGLYRPVTYVPSWGEITSNPFSIASPANNQMLRYNSTSGRWENFTPSYLTSYTETDPQWIAASGNYYTKANLQTSGSAQVHFNNVTSKPTTIAGYGITDAMSTSHAANAITSANIASWTTAYSWGNHANAGYLKSYTETDPLFTVSPASGITATDITSWNAKSNFSGSYNDLTNKPIGQNVGDMLYWDGSGWVVVPVGSNTQTLTLSNGKPVWLDPATVTPSSMPQVITGNANVSLSNYQICAFIYSSIAISAGNSTVIARGICWGTVTNPTTSNSKTYDGSGLGNFDSYICGLTANITYYARAYITTGTGTYYGNEITFIADGVIKLSTQSVSNITSTKATASSTVNSEGGFSILEQGFCWSTNPTPTISDSKTASTDITGLTPNTTYHIRAYATNSTGTYYGNELTFTTGDPIVALTTSGISSIKSTSVYVSAYITDDGGDAVTERGICWSISAKPTLANSYKSNGSGTGSYNITATELTPKTLYYVRAYATNSTGTYYGNELTFTTLDSIVTLQTYDVSDVKSTSASFSATITDDGGHAVTERGICWGTSANPTLADSYKSNGSGIGYYSVSVTGLTPQTKYYVRAYAINSTGTYYGNERTFNSSDSIVAFSTPAVSAYTCISASTSSCITDDGGNTITSMGVCWGFDHNPTLSNSYKAYTSTVVGNNSWFNIEIDGLSPSTSYYLRTYAVTADSTYYSEEVSFATPDGSLTVRTDGITYEGGTYATCNGNVDGNGTTVTEHGFCWGTKHNPTTADSIINVGAGTGTYSGRITGLSYKTTYYIRAYAVNSLGTFYGNEMYFTTNDAVVSLSISLIDANSESANIYAKIADDGGKTITSQGVCWGTTHNPTLANSYKEDGTTGIGSFTIYAEGLIPATVYYARAYAVTADSTYYSKESSFTTGGGTLIVTTEGVSKNGTSATLSGNIVSSTGVYLIITEYGFFWSATNSNPTISDSKVVACTSTGNCGNGPFSYEITGLSLGQKYYVRAYAKNSAGTFYGNTVYFITGTGAVNITTIALSSIGSSTAATGGTVSSDGGATITDKGTCWSTSPNPTISNSVLSSGSGSSSFTSSLTGLTYNTTYYLRAYAINECGTWYGNELTFTTLNGNVIFSLSKSNIGSTMAQFNVTITDNGGVDITDKGICWGTSSNPTVDDSKTSYGTGSTAYNPKITGLTAGTTYYARAYAVNSIGTWYSDQLSFTTSSNADLTDVDGNKYLTVTIGSQIWMAENLRVIHYQNGDEIPEVTDVTTWNALTSGALKFYNNDKTNYGSYGAYYNYYTVTDSRNLCPSGWHVPTLNEWSTLNSVVGSASSLLVGGNSGFNAISPNSTYYWWASTLYSATSGYYFRITGSTTSTGYSLFKYANSIRCIKD